ncbi:hypothetical protein [Bacillus mycoides]|uniref:hypothetical protein n=1 Tax=Bacillus mycoides TaxID=1405 RepID=UPI003A7FC366
MLENYDKVTARWIRLSFEKLGKNIDHLSDEEVNEKAGEAGKKVKELGIDVNTEGERYLAVSNAIFGV